MQHACKRTTDSGHSLSSRLQEAGLTGLDGTLAPNFAVISADPKANYPATGCAAFLLSNRRINVGLLPDAP